MQARIVSFISFSICVAIVEKTQKRGVHPDAIAERLSMPIIERPEVMAVTLVDDALEYIRERMKVEARLPAYAADAVAINFFLESPAIVLQVETGPYKGSGFSRDYPALKRFSMSYRPSMLSSVSPVRMALGNEPFSLGAADISLGQSQSDPGVTLEVFIESGPAKGGFVEIYRDSGKVVCIAPSGPSILQPVKQGISYELQRRRSDKGMVGRWTAIKSEVELGESSCSPFAK